MRILYATDGSEGALAASRFLTLLPLPRAEVRIVTVGDDLEVRDGEQVLAAAEQALEETFAVIRIERRRGQPAEEILRAAAERHWDLIVLGSRGLSPTARFFLGSVAEKVARHAPCPVLVARPLRGGLRQVVFGTDGSECAAYAAEWLERFPLPSTSEFRVVQVAPFWEDLIRTARLLPPYPDWKEAELAADETLREIAAKAEKVALAFAAAGRPACSEVRCDDPAEGLLQAVAESAADLLVVGSQGLSAIERFLMGSVSEKVLRHAPCSVLVVRETRSA